MSSNSVTATNNSDYLDELGFFNDSLITANDSDNDDSSVSVDGAGADDPSSFAIPALLPLSTNDGGKEQMFVREGIKDAPPPPSPTSAEAATPTATASSQRKVAVLQSYKSDLQFRTDLSKSDRDSHPCGILHFKRVGHGLGRNAPEEHVFAWISHYHNPTHLDNTLIHLQQFGFFVTSYPSEKKGIGPNTNAITTVTFLPYSSRRSWIEKYPCAFPHVYCGENGLVSGYPYWSEGGGSDDIILRASGRGVRYDERLFQARNHHHLSNTSDDVGEAISSSAAGIASTISTALLAEAHSTDVAVTETNLTASSNSSTCGRKKKKIFPTAHLSNEERDELHMEIYKYFEWLHNSVVASKKGVTTAAAGSERFNDEDEEYDELGMSSRKKKERSARGCGDGISISSLNQLMKFMESTFKVIGNSQRISQPVASLLSSSNTKSTTVMPLLEEVLSEPLRRLAAMRNPENQPRSRWKRRSSSTISGGTGIDFEDMFERLLQFQKVCEKVFYSCFIYHQTYCCAHVFLQFLFA